VCGRGKVVLEVTVRRIAVQGVCGAGAFTQRGYGPLRLGVCRALVARRTYQRGEPPSICGLGRCGARKCKEGLGEGRYSGSKGSSVLAACGSR
jgi:hypothetical protein